MERSAGAELALHVMSHGPSDIASPDLNLQRQAKEENFMRLVEPILKTYQEQQHILNDHGFSLCPADQRIQNFLNGYLADTGEEIPQLPARQVLLLPCISPCHFLAASIISLLMPLCPQLVRAALFGPNPEPIITACLLCLQLKLDRHGLAKMLSLPKGEDLFQNDIITSYRVAQGVLHNPKNDKRTTAGVFHVTEGGLPVSFEKKTVPKIAFQRLLKAALNPPDDFMTLPYTSNGEKVGRQTPSASIFPTSLPTPKTLQSVESSESF